MRWNEDVIVFEGDSLTDQADFPHRMQHLGARTQVVDVARGGDTIDDLTAQAASEVDSLLSTDGESRLFVWIGMNNLLDDSTESAADVASSIWSYLEARQALGWEITLSTLPLAEGAADTTNIIALNALLREGAPQRGIELLDIAADSRFQNAHDSTYFSADQLHLSTAGNDLIAGMIDALYYPQASSSKITYADLGADFQMISNAHVPAFFSDASFYASGAAVGGAVSYSTQGIMTRISHNDLGKYQIADFDGDGSSEILSYGGKYGNGAPISGTMLYELSGSMSRFSFNTLGHFRTGDWNNDGQMDVISSLGAYGSGAPISGTLIYNASGVASRLNFLNTGDRFELGNLSGDARLEILTSSASYSSGAAISGTVIFTQNGAMQRFSHDTLGQFKLADIDLDGTSEVVSIQDRFASGALKGGVGLYESDGSYTRLSYYEMNEFQLFDFDNDGALELITGSARLNGWETGGLVMFELSGETYHFTRLAYGEFNAYHIADLNNDGFAEVINQTDDGLVVHHFLQASLV